MAKPEDVKVGDVVKLNSGGPHMTVAEMSNERVWVVWMNEEYKLEKGCFLIYMVKKVGQHP